MSLSKKKGGINTVSKGKEKESCQKRRLGKRNILFSQDKDSISATNNGGYKKTAVQTTKPRQFGFLCI